MKSLLKFLFTTAFLVAILYAGVKGYIYFNVKSKLDDAVAMAGPFVQIEYGGISSGLDGRVGIEDILIYPAGLTQGLRVDSVSLQWPHIGYLFSGLQGASGQSLPERMTLAVEGLRLPTRGELADSLHTQHKLRLAALSQAGKTPPDACGLYGAFGGEDYAAIGFDELVLDASFGYELDEASKDMVLHLDYRTRNIQTLSMELRLTGISQPAAMMMGVIPRLKAYTASFLADPEFAARALSYCADLRGQSKAEYIQAVASEGGRGLVRGAGMRRAIERYLENPGEILIKMYPAEPLDVTTLVHYRPEDVSALLGLQVQVGGEELRDLSFDISLPQGLGGDGLGGGPMSGLAGLGNAVGSGRSGASGVSDAARQQGLASAAKPAQTPSKSRPQPRYLATKTKDLSKYLGRNVRLFTRSRKAPRNGVLVAVVNGEAQLEQRLYNGKMTIHVPMSQIKTAEVFRVPGQE